MELVWMIGDAMVSQDVALVHQLLRYITVEDFNRIHYDENDNAYCLLQLAVICDSESLIKTIIEMDVDLTVMIDHISSPLSIAVSRNSYDMLLRIGNKLTNEQMALVTTHGNLLHFINEDTDQSIYSYLLRRTVSPNVPDAKGVTPLAHAFALRNFDLIRFLIHYGADGSFTVPYPEDMVVDNTILHLLSDLKDLDVDEKTKAGLYTKLCKNSSDINKRNHNGFTPLQYAIERGNVFIACSLVWGGADMQLSLPDNLTDSFRDKWRIFIDHIESLR